MSEAQFIAPLRTIFSLMRTVYSEMVLEPDVAEVFPDAASVNEALRHLIRVSKETESDL